MFQAASPGTVISNALWKRRSCKRGNKCNRKKRYRSIPPHISSALPDILNSETTIFPKQTGIPGNKLAGTGLNKVMDELVRCFESFPFPQVKQIWNSIKLVPHAWWKHLATSLERCPKDTSKRPASLQTFESEVSRDMAWSSCTPSPPPSRLPANGHPEAWRGGRVFSPWQEEARPWKLGGGRESARTWEKPVQSRGLCGLNARGRFHQPRGHVRSLWTLLSFPADPRCNSPSQPATTNLYGRAYAVT